MLGRSSSNRLLTFYSLSTFRPFSWKSGNPDVQNPTRVGGILFRPHFPLPSPPFQPIPVGVCFGWRDYFPPFSRRLQRMKNNSWMTDMLLDYPPRGKIIGNLNDLICSNSSRDQLVEEDFRAPNCCTSTKIVKSMRDVVSALFILHTCGIVHGDIKPEKIFIDRRERLFAYLADPFLGCVSSDWMAPEQLYFWRATAAADMFSFGCVLFFCITRGGHPFGDTHDQRCKNIRKNKRNLSRIKHLPEAFDLISDLLNPDPKLRLRVLDALNHPFFWNSKTRQRFLKDTTKHIRREMKKSNSALLNELEITASTDNDYMLSCILRELFRVFSKSTGDMVNMYDQKTEVSKDAQPFHDSLRPIYRRLREYTRQYPGLIIYLYKVVSKHCQDQIWFKYYCAYQRIKNKKFRQPKS